MQNNLYPVDILSLAANIPLIGQLEKPDVRVRKTSKLCGSWHESDLCLKEGYVCAYRQRVKACALGQAAASILGTHILQASAEEILKAYNDFQAMLKHNRPPPKGRFAQLAILEPVKAYPQRHISALLAFESACAAILELCEKS